MRFDTGFIRKNHDPSLLLNHKDPISLVIRTC